MGEGVPFLGSFKEEGLLKAIGLAEGHIKGEWVRSSCDSSRRIPFFELQMVCNSEVYIVVDHFMQHYLPVDVSSLLKGRKLESFKHGSYRALAIIIIQDKSRSSPLDSFNFLDVDLGVWVPY